MGNKLDLKFIFNCRRINKPNTRVVLASTWGPVFQALKVTDDNLKKLRAPFEIVLVLSTFWLCT